MASMIVTALGRATADGHTLLGQLGQGPPWCRTPSRKFEPGESLCLASVTLPQSRQVCAVVGCQPADCWGYESGLNEHQVAVGCTNLRSALECPAPSLRGTDLVRLTLERSATARQAVHNLTFLVERFGQSGDGQDHAFLIADPTEAYAVETAGKHWVYQEVREVRAVTNVRVVAQDWDRISGGLADLAIANGWWPADGSKLDFAAALGEIPGEHAPALRRWGGAIHSLQMQSGALDVASCRHLLHELDEATPVRGAERPGPAPHFRRPTADRIGSSFVCRLSTGPTELPVAWCSLPVPGVDISLPLFPDGELPAPLTVMRPQAAGGAFWGGLSTLAEQLRRSSTRAAAAQERLAELQGRFEHETEEFLAEAAAWKEQGATEDLARQAGLFMQHNLEQLEEVVAELLHVRPLAGRATPSIRA
jgi:secernin